ncbi:MAG: hypothetical protein KC561_18200, partial [Myxococcales bacterium]|nr:hypothetical protein [Myxococcales bacterium]
MGSSIPRKCLSILGFLVLSIVASCAGGGSGGSPGTDASSDIAVPDLSESGDEDGDGLSNGDELSLYGTSPLLDDTDGDGYSDFDEIVTLGFDPERNPLRFNPLISDIPRFEIEVDSAPTITMVCSQGTESSREFTTERSTEESESVTTGSEGSESQELEFGVTMGSEAGIENIGLSYEVNASETNITTVGWSEENERTNA